ncbi:hypothetical protein K227x_33910 [Rubripirellula lacrimiformis]|uniref:Secreted protein n=1 Tax=Rubripirellula lacrimiformis TaxID=1930273 RepID=A0A517NCZ0_9BACT|nr:hypothetical protein K227x_33910 [Rubripirellula lacrimiformis]
MKSPFLALLLIANLLACPVRCISCEANVAAVEECAAAACSCCSHADEAQQSHTPEPCDGDCDCQNCICEGAVVEADVELPDSADQADDGLLLVPNSSVTVARLCECTVRRSRAPVGPFVCGRDVRLAHQSWLI